MVLFINKTNWRCQTAHYVQFRYSLIERYFFLHSWHLTFVKFIAYFEWKTFEILPKKGLVLRTIYFNSVVKKQQLYYTIFDIILNVDFNSSNEWIHWLPWNHFCDIFLFIKFLTLMFLQKMASKIWMVFNANAFQGFEPF